MHGNSTPTGTGSTRPAGDNTSSTTLDRSTTLDTITAVMPATDITDQATSEDIASGEVASLVVAGKNTRRLRCTGCRALVGIDGVDAAGLCDSCGVQRGLFAVKPWRRRRPGHSTGGGRRGR